MKRIEDELHFNSNEERRTIERIISNSDTAEILAGAIIEAISQSKMEVRKLWGRLKREYLDDGETAHYDWMTGTFKVTKDDQSTGELK